MLSIMLRNMLRGNPENHLCDCNYIFLQVLLAKSKVSKTHMQGKHHISKRRFHSRLLNTKPFLVLRGLSRTMKSHPQSCELVQIQKTSVELILVHCRKENLCFSHPPFLKLSLVTLLLRVTNQININTLGPINFEISGIQT